MPRRPKLGQHFLTDSFRRRRIVNSLQLRPDELVVEIGAGRGAMTELLSQKAHRVIAIELDAGLVSKLKEKFQPTSGVEILQADILSTDLAAICRQHGNEKCYVFGNLPYYITSPIIHHLFRAHSSIRAMALLVQREVAQRITAVPGSRAYGYLSVLVQSYSRPQIMLRVPPGAFLPAPKIQSALVHFELTPVFLGWKQGEHEKFLNFVKRCFAHKRKNLLNNLAESYGRARLEKQLLQVGLPPSIRAEQLALEQFVTLYGHLSC
jgi:16S rRNA (adenine1518-N6/adenine1519-N6)-dimethyltransferase